jgi:hypothetical protein
VTPKWKRGNQVYSIVETQVVVIQVGVGFNMECAKTANFNNTPQKRDASKRRNRILRASDT